MGCRGVIIAGDSNLKQLNELMSPDVRILCVPGARVVEDRKGFAQELLDVMKETTFTDLYLHIGSNDVGQNPDVFLRSYQDLLVQVQSVCGSTCTITLCGILPRSANLYQDEAWNEKRMPQILDSGKKLDKTLRELADRKDLRFMDCCLFVPKQHLGRDGLHLNRSGAHLLRDSLSSCIAESRLQQPVQVSTDLTDAKEGDLSCKLTYAEVLALPSKGSTAKEDLTSGSDHHAQKAKEEMDSGLKTSITPAQRKPPKTSIKKPRSKKQKKLETDPSPMSGNSIPVFDDHMESCNPRDNCAADDKCPAICVPRMVCPWCPKTFSGDLFFLDHYIRRHRGRSEDQEEEKVSRTSKKKILKMSSTTSMPAPDSKGQCSHKKTYSKRYLEHATEYDEVDDSGITYHEWHDIHSLMLIGWLCGSFDDMSMFIECVVANTLRLRLLLSGDVEQNPGPVNQFPCSWELCHSNHFDCLRSLAQHVFHHIQHQSTIHLCQWGECCYSTHDYHIFEGHVYQHIYQNPGIRECFQTLDQWSQQLPSGGFSRTNTDLHLCPPHLLSQFEILLLDECLKLPTKTYTLMDHEVYLVDLKTSQPQKFFQITEEFVGRRTRHGEEWMFNEDFFTKSNMHYIYKEDFGTKKDKDRTCDHVPRVDVYCVKSTGANRERLITSRPELVGGFQNTVQFKFHNTGTPNHSLGKRKSATSAVCVDNDTEVDPWKANIMSNFHKCNDAIELELRVLNHLKDDNFLSSKSECLATCEEKALKLASYPSCIDGIFFFTVFCAEFEECPVEKNLKFYVRFFESGCYKDFMYDVCLPRLAAVLQTDIDSILCCQVATESDVQKLQETQNDKAKNQKSVRPDKNFKRLSQDLQNKLCESVSHANQTAVEYNYFLHYVRKGYNPSLENLKSDKFFQKSSFSYDFGDGLMCNLKDYPLARTEQVSKTSEDFKVVTIPSSASLNTQSKFLNFLSNDHRSNLEGRNLYFLDRFPIGTKPASLRNKAIGYFKTEKFSELIQLFKSDNTVSRDDYEHKDAINDTVTHPKRLCLPKVQDIRKRRITTDMVKLRYSQLEDSSAQDNVQLGNDALSLSLYENYRRQMLEQGTLHIQVANEQKMVAVMNDYGDEDGRFKKTEFVYTARIKTDTGYTFTCSCRIYRTLLESIDNSDGVQWDALDIDSGVKCIHCRFFQSDIIPNQTMEENATINQIQMLVRRARTSVAQTIIQLGDETSTNNTRKFSVAVHDVPSFVHLTLNRSTNKYIVSCTNGYCRSQRGSKKNIESFMTMPVKDNCVHLQMLKERIELWQDLCNQNEDVCNQDYNDMEDPEEDHINIEISDDINDENSLDCDFDDVSGLWNFKCRSSHSARNKDSPELCRNVQDRDTWNDKTLQRVDGCLQGPNLINAIPSVTCLCSAGWTSDIFPDGRSEFDRKVIIYTGQAPVVCKVSIRLCVKEEDPCHLKWDEGHSMCVHVLSRDTAAADEIGWEFVDLVKSTKATFSAYCNNKSSAYKMRNPSSRNFMSKDVFIKWWFSWASNMKIDFRKPCPVCKYTPKILACDGTKVGIGFRHVNFEPVNKPTHPDNVQPTIHRRMDRCFLPNFDRYPKETLESCRTHLHYLARSHLNELKPDETLSEDELANKSRLVQEVLPIECTYSLSRFLTSMNPKEKTAYAKLLKMLSTTASLTSLLPVTAVNLLSDVLHFLERNDNQGNDIFFSQSMNTMRYHFPEIRNLIAESLSCNVNEDGNPCVHRDIVSLLKYIVYRVNSIITNDEQPILLPEERVGTYNPAKYGRAYYFSERGEKLRHIRKFSIDAERKNPVYDDRPMNYEFCNKVFVRTHPGARGTTSLFLWFCPSHGHCYGFHMGLAEGRKDPFASLYSHLETPPTDIFYDFACNLQEYCLNRESLYYHKVRFFHDIFHGYSHKCSSAFKSTRLFGFESINSEICEQFNSFLQCIKASANQMTQQMTQSHFCFYVQFFLHIWNQEKERKFRRRLNVALSGFDL